ncbi:MAG: hypothetical protein HQ546_03070, partial [Planctomycetes bacterium]|nr:hypothetical protein [Planctomycetota bacterium]
SDLTGKAALLVGAGDTALLAALAVIPDGVNRIVVANRTPAHAEEVVAELLRRRCRLRSDKAAKGTKESKSVRCPAVLREKDGHPEFFTGLPAQQLVTETACLSDIPAILPRVDLVLCSTGASDPVLTYDTLHHVLRSLNRTMLIVDIAVPRDVDPLLGELPNVLLYNIDHLNHLVSRSRQQRCQEINLAEAIVEQELQVFFNWLDSRQVGPTITLLRQYVHQLQQQEMNRYAGKFSEDDREQVARLTQCLCSKIMHKPIDFLSRSSHESADADELAAIDLVRRLFDLDSLEKGP